MTEKRHSITHIAGPSITVCGRTIQRCLVCGAKLVDSKGVMMPLKPDGTPDSIGTWPPGRQVRVTIGNPTAFVLVEERPDPDDQKIEKLDPDNCFATIDLL
jgi:hypothetical protein